MLNKFISLHIPKTGGTVFIRQILAGCFPNCIKKDYTTDPFSNPGGLKGKNIQIIHGHFKAVRYKHYDRPFVTWVRNPLHRMVSHYSYSLKRKKWRVAGGMARDSSGKAKPFDQYIIENSNFMSRLLDGVPLEQFAFIGVLEFWKESIEEFGRLIGTDMSQFMKLGEYDRKKNYRVSPTKKDLELFADVNRRDYALWEKCSERYR